MMAEDDPRLVFMPLEKATDPPPGLLHHYKNAYWAVHPVKGLVFYDKRAMSPQCSTNLAVAERLPKMYPWCEVRLIPSVFKQIDPHDYV